MRISSFNVESLFNRPKAMNLPTWADGRQALEQQAQVNVLLGELTYTAAIKAQIVTLLTALGLDKSDTGHGFASLRQNRGHLLSRSGGAITITASGRSEWIGWVELKREPVNETATLNTAQVLKDVSADIQAVVEAEDRISLRAFSEAMLKKVQGQPFEHVMLIDGNDSRGIDVGIMTRAGYDIVDIRSHIDDTDAKGQIFSRDCPEYTIRTPGGAELVVLVNHFKSKGFGSQAANNARRLRQASRVKDIYENLRAAGQGNVVVCGDFNDHPASAPLGPLLNATDLKDVSTHPSFDDGGRPGTFGNCTATQKFDYVLLSPALYAQVTAGAIYRCGAWGGTHGTLWDHYPNMTRAVQAASDHCAIYADLALA